jgi:hypothetical protein
MTANQVVAHNLRRAREEWNLTQEQAAVQLEPWLGTKWSKASFSIAERSVDAGARGRQFDANELLAFSLAFRRPIAWFFEPSSDEELIDVGRKAISPNALRDAAAASSYTQVELRKLQRQHEELGQTISELRQLKGGD